MNIEACLTSRNMHYCTPPRIIIPTRRLLVPPESGRTMIDPWSNSASQVGADQFADGIEVDGHKAIWSDADTSFENPPYGNEIEACVETSCHWHVEIGMPGIALYPARTDTTWMQGGMRGIKRIVGVHRSADAWLEIKGRLAFWCPIAIKKKDAPEPEKPKKGPTPEKYYLRRWWPKATADNLPAPFRLVSPGIAVGPEIAGPNGKPAHPQSAPFPSLVAFWADRLGRYDGEHPINAREFVRHFGTLGTIYVRTGEHRGVYPRRGS